MAENSFQTLSQTHKPKLNDTMIVTGMPMILRLSVMATPIMVSGGN